jgi:hypothetical protein
LYPAAVDRREAGFCSRRSRPPHYTRYITRACTRPTT